VEYLVKIKNLSVTLGGHFKALKNINLELPVSKTIGFIGPSGAGKTTLIRGIVGSLRITSGEISVFGEPVGSVALRKQVSYMTQELSIYPDLTVKENLKYFITMAGQSRKASGNILKEVLDLVDMTNKSNSLVSALSSGQKQRVSLAVALIGSPKLIVLDEPTVGLDPVLREKLWKLFSKLTSQGTSLIISSHSMDEAARCDDLVLIRDGRVLVHSSPKELLQSTGMKTIEESFLKLVGDKEWVSEKLSLLQKEC
jgi:ABC-2 type transport system ATP-binding protein